MLWVRTWVADQMKIFSFVGIALMLGAGVVVADVSHPCQSFPLLASYEEAGALSRVSEGEVRLSLNADLHSADCGAPDCYGTDLELTLRLKAEGRRCLVEGARAKAVNYLGQGCEEFVSWVATKSFDYVVEPPGADLSDLNLEKLTLRDPAAGGALVVLPGNFFYFDEVTEPALLRTSLDPGGLEDSGCCWGASFAAFRFFRLSQPLVKARDGQ